MSSNKGANSEGTPAISEKEISFIMACLQNTTGGAISVDTHAVATAVGLANPRSVNNKLSDIRKKYSIPFSAGKVGGNGSGSNEPAIPKTTSKNRVTKLKTPKKIPSKKFKSVENVDDSDNEMDDDIKGKSVTEDDKE